MRVRFRVDGVLHEAARVPKRMVSGVVSRIKIMSRPRHRREAVPQDGRVRGQRRGPQGRPACDDAADAARRGRDDPHPRQGAGAAHARRARHGRRRPRALPDRDPPPVRRRPGDRADRLGQVDHALRRAQRAQLGREERSSRSRTRSSTGSRGSARSTSTARPGSTFADRPALDPASRPRRDHGRRDPRRGDGADRDRGGADRPPRALDPAHQRRARGRSPGCRRWGSRAS